MSLKRYGWSLNREDWENIPEILLNCKWKRMELDINRADEIPAKSGLYMIIGSPPKSINKFQFSNTNEPQRFFTPIYIGSSNSTIRSRFREHIKNGKPNVQTAIKTYKPNLMFVYTVIDNNQLVDYKIEELENFLINAFGPISNSRQSATTKMYGTVKNGQTA